MALTFVYGNSGSGKSEYLYRKTVEMAEQSPYGHYFFVVPEQFTLSAQQKLVSCSSSDVIMNIDVVSFERLAWRVFDELGVHRTVMEETGKSLVLRRIAEENIPKLTILQNSLTKMGYIGELRSVISELMQYCISPDDLEEVLGELPEGSSLTFKLRDILQIYRPFEDYLREGYVTSESVLDLLTDVAEGSSILKDAVFFFDGYTGFTPVQMKLIRRLMNIASDIYVTVTIDTREPLFGKAEREELFYMSRRMADQLSRAAREAGFGTADPVRIDAHAASRFHDNPVLCHLERNLLRAPGSVCGEPCGDHLRIVSLLSPREELRFAAAGIRTLARERGYRWRDCAIVCPNVEAYAKYADSVFSLYDIPCFVDRKQPVLYHPLIELIRSVPEIADTDYSIESVFRYLRTGLAGFDEGEVDRLENFCIGKGIRGARRWKKEFDSLPGREGRAVYDGEGDAEELAELNALRQRFLDLTKDVMAVFRKKGATVRERTEAVYGLLCLLDAEGKLRAETERFEAAGDGISASVNRQIYRTVIDLLDKMVDLLGDEALTASEYAKILDAGFESAKIGTIPPGNDCVILGDIERTRLDEIRVLFLLGANDGEIPKKSSRQSILSENDREVMEAHDMELAPGERDRMFLQRFYLYLALTKPSDVLCVTFSRMDADGKAIRPSYLIYSLEDMFEGLCAEEVASNDMIPPVTPASSVESWLAGLIASDNGVITPGWKALHRWYMQRPEWAGRICSLFDAHFSVYKKESLGSALARALYGGVMRNSFTRLERFGECPYGHFLEYGLRLDDRKGFTFTNIDMGNLFHSSVQKYCSILEKNEGWSTVGEEREDAILREAMGEAVRELCDPELFESASGAYDLERAYRIMSRSVWAITEQIRRGDFLPEGYEIKTESEIPAAGGGDRATVRIVGKIDRMDVCVEDDRVSVRVIDYKSGSRKLDLGAICHGRQFQLPVYLNSAIGYLREKYPGREIVPGGIFYFHMDDPMLKGAVEDEEESRKKLLGAMKPDGFLNDDLSLVRRMDRGLCGPGTSDVVPVVITEKGKIDQRGKKTLSSSGFEDLMKYVRLIIKEMSGQMLDGIIDVSPYRIKNVGEGCKFCSFGGICGFDPRVPGYAWRDEEKLNDAQAMEFMRERLSEASEDQRSDER